MIEQRRNQRRTKLELISDILRAIRERGGRIKPTHLLYKSNLSHKLLIMYVEELSKKGMIEEVYEGEQKLISLKDKGYHFLTEYQKMMEFTETFGL